MKNLIFSIFVMYSSLGHTMHYVIDRDGTIRDTGRDRRGCVLGDSKISLENGRTISIKDLKAYHIPMNPNGVQKRVVYERVSGFEEKNLLKITTTNGKSITATNNHPFYQNSIIVKADEFRVGDRIETIDGPEEIESILSFNSKSKVYNIVLAPKSSLNDQSFLRKHPFANLEAKEHQFVVNGFISGDLLIQQVVR